MADTEARIEALCTTIMKADAENWDARNKAVLQIIDIVRSYEGQSAAVITEVFGPTIYRTLKEPIKSLISDLRSQQVRDVCTLLVVLAKVTGERMKPFLRDSFAHIIEGIKVPNKVMSGYVDDCIQNMIRYCTFKTCIPLLLMEIRESKAKIVREKCMEYLNTILSFWDMTEKDLDPICDALKIGLEDASPIARETARAVFQSLGSINPRRAERLRAELPRTVQAKLPAIEDSGNTLDTSVGSIPVLEHSTSLPEPPRTIERPKMIQTSQSMSSHKFHTISKADVSKSFSGTSSSSSLNASQNKIASEPVAVPATPAPEPPVSSSSTNVRGSTSSARVSTASASRRRSVVTNPFADISDSFAQGNSLSNSLSNSQELPSAFPKMSPSKGSPVSSKSSQRQSPVSAYQQSEVFGSLSGNSSPAGNKIASNKAPFQDRPNTAPETRTGTFSAATTIESVGSSDENQATGKELALHSRVYAQTSKDVRLPATVRFVGPTQFAPGIWVGVELDTPVGKNNGSVQGVAYFWCRPNYGLFLREENVLPFSEGEKRILALTKSVSSGSMNQLLDNHGASRSDSSPNSTAMSSSSMSLNNKAPNNSSVDTKPLSVATSSTDAVEKRSKASGMLKLKLSTVMNFLNAQLELVEELENEEKANPESAKAHQIRQEIKSITESELETIVSFRNRWKDFA